MIFMLLNRLLPAAAAEGVDEGVAARAGCAEAADVGVGARLAVLAAGQHHHVALARPERRNDIQQGD